MKNIFIFYGFIFCHLAMSQSDSNFKWWNPTAHEFQVIEGQAWFDEVQESYDRLPHRVVDKVDPEIWGLSKHSAGLMIRFRSNAKEIKIRYQTQDENLRYMDHMSTTGVSGLDLYAINSDGMEVWCAAGRTFGDTITYAYGLLNPNDGYHDRGREYRLYLPLYNQVNWMEIGVDEQVYFEPLPVRKELPIVVYGTSIAQGACASRPGMAWTSILGRKMDRPLINLGFSGSGTFDVPVIDLMSEIDAKIYVLDCLPNLSAYNWKNLEIENELELKERILLGIKTLRKRQPMVPILLVEHAGYTQAIVSEKKKIEFSQVNQVQQQVFHELKKQGMENIFYLTKEEIGLKMDDTVDGIHPTDLGMMKYAAGYEKKLRDVLKEPTGISLTTFPITQYREPENYDWENRHREILRLNHSKNAPRSVFFANSIIHFWGGIPQTKIRTEQASWDKFFTPLGLRNYAYGWDRIENLLWRVYHGELDGFDAEKIMVMIGTNNLHINTDEEILEGLHLLMDAIKIRQPKSEITLIGLLPRRDYESRIKILNFQIAQLASEVSISFSDLGYIFLNKENRINEAFFSDGLHPNSKGYLRLRNVVKTLLID
ncbi:MAG: acetylhydrolase [Flammeovirgaceae bacterium]|nr:acetylhydrolase [Flammeovirgaceae bacterium]